MRQKGVLVVEESCPPKLLANVRAKYPHAMVVSSLAQARQLLKSADLELVLCGVHLPDGNWADVLNCLVHNGGEADFLLCAARDDSRLRAEVLGRGGLGVVPPPYELPELRAHGAALQEPQLN